MFEKVNPSHPDKLADRIAGAIVDLAYTKNKNPKVAAEVLLGHGKCHIIIETSEEFTIDEIESIVERIAGYLEVDLQVIPQDEHLAKNQDGRIRCGDNGIFKGVPWNAECELLTKIAKYIYDIYHCDGKYILDENRLIICQSNVLDSAELERDLREDLKLDDELNIIINPIGNWTGGPDVDSGATNRKLGSDMGGAVTGGGLHGKDLSKADVTVNIYLHYAANILNMECTRSCAIGDEYVNGTPYLKMVDYARKYIKEVGGFEKFAEWGLI